MAGQREVLAGLRAYALGRQFEKWRGWAFYAFLEIFGTKPRRQDEQVEPKATPELSHNGRRRGRNANRDSNHCHCSTKDNDHDGSLSIEVAGRLAENSII
jgi:hypothetical protein